MSAAGRSDSHGVFSWLYVFSWPLLRGLMDKGAVTYETEGRTFVFKPTVAADKVRKSATRDLLQRVFDGSARELVSHLLKNEKLSPQELNEIKKLINEKAKKK